MTATTMGDRRDFLVAWMSAGVVALVSTIMLLLATAVVAHGAAPPAAEDSLGPGDHRLNVTAGGYERTFLVHAPVAAAKPGELKKPLAVVVMLHGAGGDGAQAARQTGWDKKADKEGFLAVFPDALPAAPKNPPAFLRNPRFWNDGSGRGNAVHTEIDDIGFIGAMLDLIERKFSVDPKRIYVTGFSSGASMTFHVAASALATRIAAVAPVSGHLWKPGAEPPARAVPLLLIYGDKDPMNPWNGGAARTPWGGQDVKPKVMDTVAAWAKFAGCPAQPVPIKNEKGVKRIAYGPGKNGAEFVFVTISGMGHTWPGGRESLPENVTGPRTDKLNATDYVWTFLERHNLSPRAETP